MASHIELNPVSHLTVGTIGPPGQRVFYLQGSRGAQTISLTMEKQQARMMGESFVTLIDELDKQHPVDTRELNEPIWLDMRLKEPVEPLFRAGNMGLGYNEDTNQVVLVAYELVDEGEEPNVVVSGLPAPTSKPSSNISKKLSVPDGRFAVTVVNQLTRMAISVPTATDTHIN